MESIASNFQVPDVAVWIALGLGVVTMIGLVIREQVQEEQTPVSSFSRRAEQRDR
jgi:hypothetical protein